MKPSSKEVLINAISPGRFYPLVFCSGWRRRKKHLPKRAPSIMYLTRRNTSSWRMKEFR
jgi:hypothetical protein